MEYIENLEEGAPKTFSTIVNNDDILQMYLKEIGRKKILSKQEEAILGKKKGQEVFVETEAGRTRNCYEKVSSGKS